MLGETHIAQRLERALQLSQAEQTEAILISQDSALTRFANNFIHQNVAERNATVMVRAVLGQRAGMATTNDLSDEGLRQAAERALAIASQQPADPDFPGLAQPEPLAPLDSFDEATAAFSPEQRAQAVGTVCRLAEAAGLTAYGAFQTEAGELAIANSNGLWAYTSRTKADFQVSVAGQNGSGWSQVSDWHAPRLDPESLGHEALDKARRAQDPRPIEPGAYTVVLDPYAVCDMVELLVWTGASAQTVQEGQSWMNGRLGKEVMSPLISIWDDGRDPSGLPLPFDFEGLPRQRVDIVRQGVVGSPVYDRYTAGKEGRQPTGHAMPGPGPENEPIAMNRFMAPGETSVEEMIATTERGLYVTRFWYTRLVHPRDCVITGMTRDGTFLIEDGRLVGPVKDLRFTQSYVEALANVVAAGPEPRTLADTFMGGSSRVPALKIEGFNFTGRTA